MELYVFIYHCTFNIQLSYVSNLYLDIMLYIKYDINIFVNKKIVN